MAALRSFAKPTETPTEFGNPSYVSNIKSRSADKTKNAVDDEITPDDLDHIQQAHGHLRDHDYVCVDRQMGADSPLSFCCRLYLPKEYSRIALSWAKLLTQGTPSADFHTLMIPDWDDTRILVFPEHGVTYVLGSDYTGEAKKSFLRLFMYEAKHRGGLGLHAGTKRVTIREPGGGLRRVGQLFLGLSATGKTTLTCHGFDLTPPERAELVQDDVCALLQDGSVAGSEGGGLYIKTDGLSPTRHKPLYDSVTNPHAVLENVRVNPDGAVDFSDNSLTSNGRATIRRDDLPNAADDINLPHVDHIFFITRNPLMPPVARLTPAAGAAAFMLGESIQTSAGDPDRAGEAVRVVGTNPFIIGSRGNEGNRFLDLIRATDTDCFTINTGHLGDDAKDITVEHTVAIIRAIARDKVDWRFDARLGLHIPAAVPGIDIDAFYPPAYVDQYDEKLAALRADRREYLEGFSDLDDSIIETTLAASTEPTSPD